ncbi:hypothetical protein ACIBCD_41415 [Nocardia brasiliensis]|uniref:hypothetical protein n=1 Tax=Nocardia brasiliensis TaxID=37326 RepID=UPI00378AE90A
MIDIDAPEDVLAAANEVADVMWRAVGDTRMTVDRFELPAATSCSLDVAGNRCAMWIRTLFESALTEYTTTAVTINEAVVRTVGEFITTDTAMGASIRHSAES